MAAMSDDVQTATLANWRESPRNQWSFHNINKIMPTQTIKKASMPAAPFAHDLRSFDTFRLESPSGTSLDLEGFLSASQSDGLIVLHDSKVVLERYARQGAPEKPHIIMSMTKSICGLLVGILQAHGKLSVDDLISKHVPKVAGTPYERATIRQCIDMRSGVDYDDSSLAYRIAAGSSPPTGAAGEHHDLHSFLEDIRAELAKDDRFEYVSPNADLMGWVLERASGGRTFAKLVQDLLWEPMGAESEAWMATDVKGNARASGGMCATLRDVARVGQLLANDGKVGGKELVPSSWIEDIMHGGDKDAFARGAWAAGSMKGMKGLAYRSYCLAMEEEDTIVGLGVFGQMLFVDRRNKIVMVKFASQKDGVDSKMTVLGMRAWQEVKRVVLEDSGK